MLEPQCWARLHKTLSPVLAFLLLIWLASATAGSVGPAEPPPESTSYNDPCRVISLSAPKPAEPPMCYLKPTRLLEPVEEDLLLSFEEWKASQLQGPEHPSRAGVTSDNGSEVGDSVGKGGEPRKKDDAPSSQSAGREAHHPRPSGPTQQVPRSPQDPSPVVPIIDRFNYASLDCSARVHKAHKGAKHASNILSSKKDRYMLSPCKVNGPQFVIIELCEDIRVDVVEIANFEFFSGVFKDVTVSVAKTSGEGERWTVLGSWKAKNVRGIQTFRPHIPLKGFYRYLRIDFHSYYGSEYYCPVSLVGVYGFTHLEEWKWELYEDEKAKLDATSSSEVPIYRTVDSATDTMPAFPSMETTDPAFPFPSTDLAGERPSLSTPQVPHHSAGIHYLSPLSTTEYPDFEVTAYPPSSTKASISSGTPISSTYPTASPKNASPASSLDTATSPTSIPADTNASVTCGPPSIVQMPTPNTGAQGSVPLSVSGGESIFRTIMNRVLELERNHTLYEQYMARQQFLVREALKRLGEDVGRLEGLGKAQRQIHDRAVHEWEKQRKRWQFEHGQLLQRIDYLTDEIIMEKRLGVAQLCLLLAVLVFMGLTRGSRGPIDVERRPLRTALKSLSDDWRHQRSKSGSYRSHIRNLSSTLPFRPLRAANSGTNFSSGEVDDTISATNSQRPLRSIDLNILSHRDQRQQRRRDRGDHGSENVPSVYLRTYPHNRSRTMSGSRSRTSSWINRGQTSNSRQGVEARAASVTNTPSKSVRASSTLGPIRLNLYNSKDADSVQRSQSSQGTIDLALEEAWGASRGIRKGARTWARTAHLHEVKQKRGRHDSGPLFGGGANGDSNTDATESTRDDGSDVFGVTEKEPEVAVTPAVDGDTDADGWESASDVEY